MIEVIMLAIALSMDAFAVSIGLGAQQNRIKLPLAFFAGAYFGFFQAAMPIIGYAFGASIFNWAAQLTPWIAFLLLAFIGGKMVRDSFSKSVEDKVIGVSHKTMLVLAVATSIDAMAAGFTLTLIPVDPFIACLIIGSVTFIFSMVGVVIGKKGKSFFGSKAELLGGVVLIAIGIKFLIS